MTANRAGAALPARPDLHSVSISREISCLVVAADCMLDSSECWPTPEDFWLDSDINLTVPTIAGCSRLEARAVKGSKESGVVRALSERG